MRLNAALLAKLDRVVMQVAHHERKVAVILVLACIHEGVDAVGDSLAA